FRTRQAGIILFSGIPYFFEKWHDLTTLITFNEYRMHIVLPAYRPSISKARGRCIKGGNDILFIFLFIFSVTQFIKCFKEDLGSRPGPEIFRRKLPAAYFMNIFIDH